jgi:hypothetical protein
MAYVTEGGVPAAVGGDKEAPHIKAPPFNTIRETLYTVDELNLASTYVFTPDISVHDYRILTLYIRYDVQTINDQLSLVPEFSMEDRGDTFWPIGVVNSNITQVNLTDTSVPFEPPFGSRNIYPTELRTVALAAGDSWRSAVQFDVSGYNRFRFGVGALLVDGTAGLLDLSYSLNV